LLMEATSVHRSADLAGSSAPGDGGWQVSSLRKGPDDGGQAVDEEVKHVTAHNIRAVRATTGNCDAADAASTVRGGRLVGMTSLVLRITLAGQVASLKACHH
jgi:hypothetical protein